MARARAGVACRVLVDALGSPNFASKVSPGLRAAGCEVRIFRPGSAVLQRNHRKAAVIDGGASAHVPSRAPAFPSWKGSSPPSL